MNRYSLLTFVIWSLNLALAGILFAYFISFPAAIQFLTDFAPASLVAIITAEEYLRFAVFYIGGFALIFQLPLLITFIDSNRPLNPQSMIKYQRHLIVGSFILAAILTPTPDPVNQLMMAIPPIVLYYISVVIVYLRRYQRQKNAMPIIEKVRIPVQTPHPETHVVPVNWLPAEPRTLIMDIRPAYRS
jgi:sec-independent protein translocase protein TatC